MFCPVLSVYFKISDLINIQMNTTLFARCRDTCSSLFFDVLIQNVSLFLWCFFFFSGGLELFPYGPDWKV